MKNTNTVTYQNLNIFKALAAFFVIILHTHCQGQLFNYTVTLTRTGVSLFFMISGFFLCSTQNLYNFNIKSKNKLIKTLKLTFWAYLFYFFWDIFVRYTGTGLESVKSWFSDIFTPFTLVRILIFHEDVLAGHLWFLNSLIICYLIVYLIGDKIYSKKVLYLSVILLVSHIVIANFIPFLTGVHISMAFYRNGWLYGFPVFVLGAHLRKWTDSGNQLNNNLLIAGILISFPLVILECYIFGYHQLYISNILMVTSIFIWCIQNPIQKHFKILQILGADYFTEMFVLQLAVINVIVKVYSILGLSGYDFFYVLVCVIGTVFCSVLYKYFYRIFKKKMSGIIKAKGDK